MSKFINVGYVSESKKSKEGQSEKTYVLTIKPQDKSLSSVELPAGSKVLLRAPKQGKLPDDKFEEILSWKLFDAVLIVDDNNEGGSF